MQLLVVTSATVVLAVFAYWFANTYFKARISQGLMADSTPYALEGEDHSKTLLILGDSTAYGVGADKPEDSVAGRLAAYLGATYTENPSVIGAGVADLGTQIQAVKEPCYDFILIQIGGNDIIPFKDAKESAEILAEKLASLPPAGQVVLMSAGNVGGSTLFPPFIRPFHTMRNLEFHTEFEKVAKEKGILYVNLYEPFWKDPFLRDPKRYLSRDGLHPSTYGYGLWFDKLKAALEK